MIVRANSHRKTYNFIIEPNPCKGINFDLDKNPFSSHHINPKTWAKILLRCHPTAQRIVYKAVNGRKVYTLENNTVSK